jgi:hypothetical protein
MVDQYGWGKIWVGERVSSLLWAAGDGRAALSGCRVGDRARARCGLGIL